MKTINVQDEEFNTILAALRFYRHEGMGEPDARPDWLQAIACPEEDDTSLDAEAIDTLCERINCDSQPEYKVWAPTYYGDLPEHERGELPEWGAPRVPIVTYEAEGLRMVLGAHDKDDYSKPDIAVERRPGGYCIFLHPEGGGDPAGYVYFLDDGRSFVSPEYGHNAIQVLEPHEHPPELDQVTNGNT